ncbi:DUF721 domain-containing protein [Elioraea tepida]|jgi:hypothetical protein|uniref:DUF721 domain-containing protein n=1 Tax=Elioraea tepida TaxID=2843330 RepID=A0A975U475_9PROT|nr:DciA family protein [Elioraea tepida]QXM24741.1 DUF721 domain-containing protein [Elioraea tepida]
MAEDSGKLRDDAPAEERLAAGPVPIAGLLSRITRPAMRSRGGLLARLALDWPEIVGPAIAAVTAPERLSCGRQSATLTIRASGPMALELSHLAPELLARINARLGRDAVARLRFSAGSGRRATTGAGAPPLPLPKPPSREAVLRAAAAVADLPEGPLKEALARLGAEVLARR